MECGALPDV